MNGSSRGSIGIEGDFRGAERRVGGRVWRGIGDWFWGGSRSQRVDCGGGHGIVEDVMMKEGTGTTNLSVFRRLPT